MNIKTGLDMSGIKELESALRDKLPAAFANKVGVAAFRAGADVITKAASANAKAHQDTGHLSESIESRANVKTLVSYSGRTRVVHKGQFIIKGLVGVRSNKKRVWRFREGPSDAPKGFSNVNPFTDSKAAFERAGIQRRAMKGKEILGIKAEFAAFVKQKAEFDSWAHVRTRKGYWQLSDPRRYAHLVEFGTVKSRAMPFMRPAIESHGQEAIRAIAAEMERGLPDAIRAASVKQVKALTGGFKS